MQPTTPPRFAAFGPRNYRLMWLGIVVLALGFITMTLDKADYGEGFLGITLGPILLVVGFIIEFFAILVRDPSAIPAAPASNAAPLSVTMSDAPVSTPAAAPAAPTRPSYKPL